MANDYMKCLMDLDIELVCGGISSSMMNEVYKIFNIYNKKVTCYTLACYNEEKMCENTYLLDTTFDRTKKLYTESIVNQVRSNVSPKVASTRLKRKNAKNLLFELKLNMSFLLSKIFSLFVKLDIEVNESSLLN